MNLYLIRHTKVDVPSGTCYGQTDVPVLPSFPEEVKGVKTKLEGIEFSHCFSSPLARCRLLAEAIVPGSISVQYDDRLKELHFGEWEGKLWCHFDQTVDAKKWFGNYWETPSPGGESYLRLVERVRIFIEGLKKLPDDATVMIVSHGGPIRAFLILLENIDPAKVFDIEVGYGEVKRIKQEKNKE
jgi:alpha-ribazole phosphatase